MTEPQLAVFLRFPMCRTDRYIAYFSALNITAKCQYICTRPHGIIPNVNNLQQSTVRTESTELQQ